MADRFEDKRINEALELLNEVAKDKKAELREMVTDRYGNLKSLIEGLGEKVQHDAAHAYHAGKEKIKEVAGEIDESVHRNPWPYIGGTAVMALLLGYLLGRSKK